MSQLSAQEANALIAQKLEEVKKIISECETLADEHGLTFASPVGEYGMGGTYYGTGWDSSDSGCEWENSDSQTGWVSSSSMC